MSNERPIKKPGRSGAAFRSGPMVENPGKMLGRLMGYIFKNYRIHNYCSCDRHCGKCSCQCAGNHVYEDFD